MTDYDRDEKGNIVPEPYFHDSLSGAVIGGVFNGIIATRMLPSMFAVGVAVLCGALIGAIIQGNWWNIWNRELW